MIDDESASSRSERRRARAAADFRRNPTVERMREALAKDADAFDRTYGPRGRIAVGFYESDARAAGIDLDATTEEEQP